MVTPNGFGVERYLEYTVSEHILCMYFKESGNVMLNVINIECRSYLLKTAGMWEVPQDPLQLLISL